MEENKIEENKNIPGEEEIKDVEESQLAIQKENETENKTIVEKEKTKKGYSVWTFMIIGALLASIGLFAYSHIESPVATTTTNESILSCIASSSQLYVATGCGYCANQKKLLGESLSMFNVIDCRDDPDACTSNNIKVVPTWVINNETLEGYRTIENLKEAANC